MNENTKGAGIVTFIKYVVKAYFITALGISFSHFIHAFNKLGLYGWGAASMPVAIDGLAIVGMLMQSKHFAKSTRKTGKWMQLICGSLSLTVNVYSGWGHPGPVIQGVTWVTIYMVLEVISGNIKPASADTLEDAKRIADEAQAIADAANAWMSNCGHPTKCATEAQCNSKTVATAKAAKTRAAKARKVAAQNKALASLVNG